MSQAGGVSLNNESSRRHRPDYWLVIISAVLLSIGLIVVYAISPGLSAQNDVSANYYVNKQLLAVVLSVIAFIVCAHLPIALWRRLQKPFIIAAVVTAIIVRLFGERVNGAYRWIQVGGMSFQAVELIKFALLIWLAGFLVERIRTGTLADKEKTLKPVLILLAIIGIVVAFLQSDLGSMGVLAAMMAAMVYVAGLPLKRIAMIAGIIVMGALILILVSPYRRDRVMTFLNPTGDCQDTGYQSCQALISIGSGGMFGRGLGSSVQAYGYQPEAANDSIFAISAEIFGFMGMSVMLGLFIALFTRLKRIIERTKDDYSRLLATGILAWLSTQAIINIGAMLGLLPLKGITLPFISYGGTSLLFVAGAVGVAFQISRYSSYLVTANQKTEGNRYAPKNYAVEYRGR